MPNPRCFLDVSVGEQSLGRVVFELFADRCPKTVENFRCLCTGEKGVSSSTGKPLHYKGAPFHRIIEGFMCQGGDTTTGNGKGGESIYGSTFEDENLDIELDSIGLLAMANRGPDTNSSQFFITLAACPHLNGKHTVFGKIVAGLNVVEQLALVSTDSKDRPLQQVLISHCGELELRKKAPVAMRERSESVSDASDERERKRQRKKEKREKKERKSKSKKRRSVTPEPTEEELAAATRQKEMAEEEDRRLAEEKRRAEAERKRELERIRDSFGGETNGVVLKGRGAMKYREGGSGMRGWN